MGKSITDANLTKLLTLMRDSGSVNTAKYLKRVDIATTDTGKWPLAVLGLITGGEVVDVRYTGLSWFHIIPSLYTMAVGGIPVTRMQWGSMSKTLADMKPNLTFYDNGESNWCGMGCSNDGNFHVRVGVNATEATMFSFIKQANTPYLQVTAADSKFYACFGTKASHHALIKCNTLDVTGFDASTYVPVKASAFTVASSLRYKENIKDVTEDEANKILMLRPVSFDYKDECGGSKDQFGFVAEEVNDIIPSTVVKDEENQPDAIDYSKFTAHLVKLVQIQQEEINSLKNENTELRSRLDGIEAKVVNM